MALRGCAAEDEEEEEEEEEEGCLEEGGMNEALAR
jgi:hypothetical protein